MSKLFSVKTILRNTLFVVTVLGFAVFFTYPRTGVSPNTAYATPNVTTGVSATPTTTATAAATNTGSSSSSTNCAVEKIGWIVCPIMEGAAKATDKLFQFLADHFLVIDAELLTTQDTGTRSGTGTATNNQCTITDSNGTTKTQTCKLAGAYNAWKQALNLANIMFIIAFVIIVLSQVTNTGLTNYGIKRMLPRLIVAAIAVNVSYYICQGMVDLSNILGYEIMHALQQIADQVGPAPFSPGSHSSTATGNGLLTAIVVGVLGAAAIVWIILPVSTGVILGAFIIVLIVVIILLLRKAFIILLVVASPFAFVAYLLPNTEQYFHKWLSMFWKLLMVFPIVALLMGGGQLASAIILAAGSQPCGGSNQSTCTTVANTTDNANTTCSSSAAATNNTTTNTATNNTCVAAVNGYGTTGEGAVDIGDNRQVGWTLGLVATGIAVAPLLAVWSVLQGAISAAGAIGGKITSAVSKGAGGVVNGGFGGAKWGGGKLKNAYKESTVGQMRARKAKIREGEIMSGAYTGKRPVKLLRSKMNKGLNAVGKNAESGPLKDYYDQRERGARKERAQRAREKAEEFEGTGQYSQEFTKALAKFADAQASGNQHGMNEAEVDMNAAMIAASRRYDQQAVTGMQAQLNAQRSRVHNKEDAHTQAIAENAQRDHAAQAAQQREYTRQQSLPVSQQSTGKPLHTRYDRAHEEALETNSKINHINDQADRYEEASAAGKTSGPVTNVDVAHELANREAARRNGGGNPPPTPPPPGP